LARLLEKHNLTIAELEAAGQEAGAIVEHRIELKRGRPTQWRLLLANEISETYFCSVIVDREAMYFIGRADNVAAFQVIYEFLVDELCRLSRESRREYKAATGRNVNPSRWQASFGTGAAASIADRLDAERARRTDEVQALVHLRADESEAYLDQQYGGQLVERRRSISLNNAAAWREGMVAGDNINLKPLVDDGGNDSKERLK